MSRGFERYISKLLELPKDVRTIEKYRLCDEWSKEQERIWKGLVLCLYEEAYREYREIVRREESILQILIDEIPCLE